nr:serine/arginine repetitive matrix protein 1-like [Aegilops tauschii subsp. strangulata]
MRASARARLHSAAGSRKPARSLPPRARAGRLPHSAASRSLPARNARTGPGNPVNVSAHQRAASPFRAPWPAAWADRAGTLAAPTARPLHGSSALRPASYASAPELFSARTRPSRWLRAPQHPTPTGPATSPLPRARGARRRPRRFPLHQLELLLLARDLARVLEHPADCNSAHCMPDGRTSACSYARVAACSAPRESLTRDGSSHSSFSHEPVAAMLRSAAVALQRFGCRLPQPPGRPAPPSPPGRPAPASPPAFPRRLRAASFVPECSGQFSAASSRPRQRGRAPCRPCPRRFGSPARCSTSVPLLCLASAPAQPERQQPGSSAPCPSSAPGCSAPSRLRYSARCLSRLADSSTCAPRGRQCRASRRPAAPRAGSRLRQPPPTSAVAFAGRLPRRQRRGPARRGRLFKKKRGRLLLAGWKKSEPAAHVPVC